MEKLFKVFVIIFLLVFAGNSYGAEIEAGKPAPDFTCIDVFGKDHTLSELKGKIVVLEWVNYECPFVKKHYGAGNMQALQKKYVDKGIVWLSICSSAPDKQGYFTSEEVKRRIEEQNAYPTAYLIDESGDVGRLYGAKTTPHMFVIDSEGLLVYGGALDDHPHFWGLGLKNANNYVAEALDAVLEGRPVEVQMTKPYGCSVKY